MVDIPVERRDPVDAALGQRMHRGDGNVAKDAKSASTIAFGVVARRTHQGVGVVDIAVEHSVDRGDRSACRQ